MSLTLAEDTKTILLLCASLQTKEKAKPLTTREYSSLARWLYEKGLRPKDMQRGGTAREAAFELGINAERLEALLGRGVLLAGVLEEWQRHGLWVIGRPDEAYPSRYRKNLGDKAPPLLFGAGDFTLLDRGGLAIVGSRNVGEAGEEFAINVGRDCALKGIAVISGAARGVDLAAMNSSMENNGHTIGVLADNLLKKSTELCFRRAIGEGRLVLVSPYNPRSPFNIGNAMGRNRLIYALADQALVVSCDCERGGTWAGATEELKRKNHIPVHVRNADLEGNRRLLEMGAIAWENFDPGLAAISDNARENSAPRACPVKGDGIPHTIYEAVLPVILGKLETPMTLDDLANALEVKKAQLGEWLKKAVADELVGKIKKPARYCRIKACELKLGQ